MSIELLQRAEQVCWDGTNADLLQDIYAVWGGIENAKQPCENTFAECRDIERANKNMVVSEMRPQHAVATMELSRKPEHRLPTLELQQEDTTRQLKLISSNLLCDDAFKSTTHEVSKTLLDSLKESGVPGGPKADHRQAAAYAAIRDTAADQFESLANAWLSVLMAPLLAFQITDEQGTRTGISLGHGEWGALLWAMKPWTVSQDVYWTWATDADYNDNEELCRWETSFVREDGIGFPAIRGLLMRPVAPLEAPPSLPKFPWFRQIGSPQPFVRFAIGSGLLRAGVSLTQVNIKRLLAMMDARFPKGAKQTNKNLCTLLVSKLFSTPSDSAQDRRRVLETLLKAKDEMPDMDALEAIELMDADCRDDFKDLEKTTKTGRHGHTCMRGETLSMTPRSLREFISWRGHLPGCYIHRPHKKFYTGYYPGGGARTRVWGGARTKHRSEQWALEEVLKFM